MIERIIFLEDLYRRDQKKNITMLYLLMTPIFSETNLKLEILTNEKPLTMWESTLRKDAVSILSDYNLNSACVIAFELNPVDKIYLQEKGIPWINIEIHPIRFLDDLCFSVTSSFQHRFADKLIQRPYIDLCVNKQKIKNYGKTLNLKPNSLLIIAQTKQDKSVYFDNEFKSLLDYIDALRSIAKGYDNIYYRSHPLFINEEVDKMIISEFNAEYLNSASIYDILCDNSIKGVAGISSSVLHEAAYFNKEVHFLEQRIKHFNDPVFLKDLYDNHELWRAFIPEYKPNDSCSNIYLSDNMCRDCFGYWAYETKDILTNREIYMLKNHVSIFIDQTTNRLLHLEASNSFVRRGLINLITKIKSIFLNCN